MQTLYAKAAAHNRQCLFVEFPNGMHMDTWLAGGDHYWRTIQQFLEQHLPEKKENDSSRNNNGKLFLLNSSEVVLLRTLPLHFHECEGGREMCFD
jgi:hypothetical protein